MGENEREMGIKMGNPSWDCLVCRSATRQRVRALGVPWRCSKVSWKAESVLARVRWPAMLARVAATCIQGQVSLSKALSVFRDQKISPRTAVCVPLLIFFERLAHPSRCMML